jgi:acyl-CoA synthetase (NDP forming)
VLREHDSPVVALPYPESAASALALAVAHADWLARPAAREAELGGIDTAAARRILDQALNETPDGWLAPTAVRALLETYGIPVIPERIAASPEEAVATARDLGFPAVVKTTAPGVHKTEVGGVAVDLRDAEAVRAAAERIGCPVIVQPFLRGRTELLAGIVQDPVFGPLVAFGPGGELAELIGEASFRLAPLDPFEAAELVTGGKAGVLVAGFRGAPAADTGALADVVLRLARLAADLPELAELDLNPILAGPDGCVSVDARVRITRLAPERRLKTW